MANAISNTDSTIDSRDVIARIEELRALDELEDEEKEELLTLETLAEQGEKYAPDWKYGAQLIHEDYFEEAMDELLEDIGDIPRDLPSYLTITVDYDALKQDYAAIDFDGQTYYVR